MKETLKRTRDCLGMAPGPGAMLTIPSYLNGFAAGEAVLEQPAASDPELDRLLDRLYSQAAPFRPYRRSFVSRRLSARMNRRGVEDPAEYERLLHSDPTENAALLRSLRINVTGFFRDARVWGYLRDEWIPSIADRVTPASPLRIWSAGCSTGEEAYTWAVLLAEALGLERYRRSVRILGTDIDESSLAVARRGGYSEEQAEGVPAGLLPRYFDRTDGGYRVNGELMRSVRFMRHDLLSPPPVQGVDLLSCRNTLIYFTLEAQAEILTRFCGSLKETGHLLLGQCESAVGLERQPASSEQLAQISAACRLYRRRPTQDLNPH